MHAFVIIMRNLTLFLLFSLTINFAVLGQTSIGIRSGMILSTITGRAEPQAVAVGGTTGMVVQHKFSERIGLNTELLFDTKGYVSRTEVGGNKVKEKSRLQYIDIPITFRTYFGKNEVNKGFVGIGPHIGLGLYEKYIKIEHELFNKEKTLIRDPFTDKKRFEAGLDVEMGYVFELKENRALELNFRQVVAFTKLSDITLLGKIRNLYMSFSIAYLFGLDSE